MQKTTSTIHRRDSAHLPRYRPLLLALAACQLLTLPLARAQDVRAVAAAAAAPAATAAPAAAAAPVAATATADAPATVVIAGARVRREPAQATQRTPTAASRVSGVELEQQNVSTLDDLQQFVPSLNIQSTDPSDMQISIRGVGDGGGQASGDGNIGMPSSVAVYLDNVYLARPGMLGNGLGDLEYAEVLSGAQGTAFGANATGGVLDLHTRAPSFTPQASVSVSAGQRGVTRGSAMLTGPLGGDWAGRLNLMHSSSDGNITNVHNGDKLNGTSSNGLRGQLLYQADTRFSLRLSADYNNINNTPTAALVATHAVNGKDTFLTHAAAVGAHVVYGNQVDLDDGNIIHVLQGGASAEANWLLDSGYKLRSVTSARYFATAPSVSDGLSVPVYANTGTAVLDRSWSQEFRLDSPAGPVYDYALGLTYLGQNLSTTAHTRYSANNLANVFYDAKGYTSLDVIRFGTLHDHMLSPYAQGTWHASDKLDVIAGLRLNYEEKGGQFVRFNKANFNSGYIKQYTTLPSATLTANYQFAPGLSGYAAASYGEKSGGINVSAGAAGKAGLDSLILKPEKTKSAEVGAKGSWYDNTVSLKGDVFFTEVSDFQTQGYDPVDQQTYLMNAGSFRSRGAEATLRLTPTRALRVDFAAVYNQATYLDYDNARCAPEVTLAPSPPPSCKLTGARVFNAPRVTYSTSARYGWNSAGGLDSYVSARYAYRGWMYGTVDNSQFTRVAGYGLAALSAGTGGKAGAGEWGASVWLNNAFNKTYYRRLVNSDYGSVQGWLGDPRTLGVTLTYKY